MNGRPLCHSVELYELRENESFGDAKKRIVQEQLSYPRSALPWNIGVAMAVWVAIGLVSVAIALVLP
jgi:hypothetical protein